ncbi:MAG TPA: hypothetical protein VIQ30_00225 [Pseudonocardia sp.]
MRAIAIAGAVVLLVAGCSDDQTGPTPGVVNQPSTPASPAPSSSATPTVDPYQVYLANAPKGEPTLSREDASTRALLGCETTWPPGTVDAVLQEAYAAYCK